MVADVLRGGSRGGAARRSTATASSATCGGEKPAVAHVTASIRFWRASERGMSSGSCEPVRMMGLRKPASISDSALAVYGHRVRAVHHDERRVRAAAACPAPWRSRSTPPGRSGTSPCSSAPSPPDWRTFAVPGPAVTRLSSSLSGCSGRLVVAPVPSLRTVRRAFQVVPRLQRLRGHPERTAGVQHQHRRQGARLVNDRAVRLAGRRDQARLASRAECFRASIPRRPASRTRGGDPR